jgi:hypothetical protein
MSEFDFEELLDDVLREDAQVEPLQGMNERVMARISAETRRSSQRWMMWAAGAVAAGALVWVIPHARPRLRGVVSSASVLRVDPVGGAVAKSGRDPLPLAVDGLATRKRVRSRRLRDVQRQRPLQIAPIEVAPLTVAPIEIASLGMEQKEKGDIR